ncbi:MAG TPA: lysoplasmalogenase [Jatrophihabitans sp.]|nr:lysoplasmalogenase [Jatrophihabitans sp.]
MTVALLVLAGVVAVLDWAAVHGGWSRTEHIAKPLALALLVAAAATADLGPVKPWVIAALVLGLLGDVGLLLSKSDEPDPPFLAGLGAFLVGHVCYVVAFLIAGVSAPGVLVGVLVVGALTGTSLPAVLRGALAADGRLLAGLVALYAVVLGAMAVLAVGTGVVATGIGGVLFVVSDTLLARERFVRAVPQSPLLVIVTYHLAQALILIGLVRW